PSLAVPHLLHEQGVPHIAAPLATADGALWASLGDYALSLYRFIDGRMGADGGLSPEQWRTLGTTVRQVHTSRLPPELRRIVPREAFVPSRRELMEGLEAALDGEDLAGPAARELAALWQAQRDVIHTVVAQADTLADRLRQQDLPLALCHADLHTWNVLVDARQEFWLIDWDETILAPKERDLMFVVVGIASHLVGPHDTACFLAGYGDAAIDQVALTYYRYAWAVQDMAAFAERALLLPDLSEETRREAVHGFAELFEPGQIVAIAQASDGAGN
ncbi:MAG TPA: phosphotransferase, partial [Anaerolineae bacterium]|nr:phosphotransferase [Anaerolineae bacterium]